MVSTKITKTKLTERGIAPELVDKVVDDMNMESLTKITKVGVAGLIEAGLGEEEANMVFSSLEDCTTTG